MYTRKQVYEATLKYFKGNPLPTDTWVDKYCLKKEGKYFELTPDDMHKRLAKEFARIEAKYPNPMSEEEVYALLKDFEWIIPQGSPMAGIGNNHALMSISNCFVIGNHVDSYGGIMKADQEQAQLMKKRGGVGQDLDWIRPSGAIASATPLGPNAGTTLYMDRFSNTTREVQQDGRRGALMLSIGIKHPDAEKFIDKKMKPGSVTGANVSVRISNDFMKALNNNALFAQTFPTDLDLDQIMTKKQKSIIPIENELYEGKQIRGQRTYWKMVDPKKIWKKIIHNAWNSAEPGILFWDKILKESPARGYGILMREVSTNPCGEIPLPPNDSCRLLAVNLLSFITNAYTKDAMLEDRLLVDIVNKAQRLMDDLVELEIEKIDQIIADVKSKKWPDEFQLVELELWNKIKNMAVMGRRTGLGITAEGDAIAAIGYQYGTKEASLFSEKLHQLIATAAYEASVELAEERGSFPLWNVEDDAKSEFIQRMFGADNELMTNGLREKYAQYGRRNIGVLTIAPTGSLSILAEVSSGIEPVFALWHFRKKKIVGNERIDFVDEEGDEWTEYAVMHKPFITWYSVISNISYEEAKETLAKLTSEQLDLLSLKSPWYGATAQAVDYVEKARMQGQVQQWVDHSISVTVNMPEDVTEEMVESVYLQAFLSGCKGITVYRDNSRGNVLSTQSVKDVEEKDGFDYVAGVKRPKHVPCDIFFKSANKDPYILLVGKIEGKPYEIFTMPYNEKTKFSKTIKSGVVTKLGKGNYVLTGDNDMPLIENISSHMIESEKNTTRLISGMLRHRTKPIHVANIIDKFAIINSFHKVVGRVLRSYVADEDQSGGVDCPSCETGKMQMTEGCMKCSECGYAHCG